MEPEAEESRDVKLVKVRTFSGPSARLEADLAKNLLQEEGISCILPGEVSVGLYPVLDLPLRVREDDAERATTLLEGYFDAAGPVADE